MKFKVFIVFLFFVCCLLLDVSLAQNRAVIIPLGSDCSAVKTVTSAAGRVWMDRNLGALRVAQSVDDYHAYGWLYQWGRSADGHEIRSSTTAILSDTTSPGHGHFIYTIPDPPYDWLDPQFDNLWYQGLNNPCPTGFRVPTSTEWETERGSWSSNDSAGAFASPLKLVLGGIRNYIDGTYNAEGIAGYYWSSTVDSFSSRSLIITINDALTNGFGRANGMSVRCIKN